MPSFVTAGMPCAFVITMPVGFINPVLLPVLMPVMASALCLHLCTHKYAQKRYQCYNNKLLFHKIDFSG